MIFNVRITWLIDGAMSQQTLSHRQWWMARMDVARAPGCSGYYSVETWISYVPAGVLMQNF
jgi:hypothetical protein